MSHACSSSVETLGTTHSFDATDFRVTMCIVTVITAQEQELNNHCKQSWSASPRAAIVHCTTCLQLSGGPRISR